MKASTIFCTECGAANPTQARFCFACGQAVQGQGNAASGSVSQTGQIKPGELLRKRYEVLNLIGQGGFGAVYKAEDKELGQRLVAVKEMGEQGLSQSEIDEGVEAFKREALMLAGLMHEHLPRIYDHFEEDGHWYLVMDYIEGETLEEHFSKSRDGSLPLPMALKIALQICEVLDYLHTRQPPIIFRDLKPANIILTPKGNLFLIDFGIARHFKPGQAKDTIAFGSPGYASPEQYGKAQTTPRADIYSLGAILHQMLSGDDPSISPFRFAPLFGQDPSLQQLIALMLEMDEDKRPLNIAVVRQSLQYISEHAAKGASAVLPVLPAPMVLKSGQILPALPGTLHMSALPGSASPLAPVLIREHHYGVVRAVAWSQKSMYAASATDAIVRVWNAHTGQNLCSYREHLGVITHMAWSATSTHIASVSEENKVRIWDAFTGQTISVYPNDPQRGFQSGIAQQLAWSGDGRYLAVASSRSIHIWDTYENHVSARLRSRPFSGYRAISWSPDGKSLAAAQASKVLVYQLDKKPKTLYYRYNAPVNAVAWSPDGTHLASGGYDHMVHVWNTRKNELVGVYHSHVRPISALAWSPDSQRIASGSLAANVNVWDALSGVGILSYHAHAGDVLALAWSPDGRFILSGGSDCKACVWKAP
jgi:serine/threonine protein kinase